MPYDKKEALSRTELMLGTEAMERLSRARVAIFGIGGVGGYAFEALVRSGIGTITVIDSDKVSTSNLNRQIIATLDTVGRAKTEVAAERARSINPDIKIIEKELFYTAESSCEIDFEEFDYIVDAIDTVSSKIHLIVTACEKKIPIISSMGAGNKLDPTAFKVADIYKTSVCPLARVMRNELKRRGVKKLKCVYSEESAIKAIAESEDAPKSRHSPASIATIPSVVGLIIASEVIKDIIKIDK